MKHIKHAGKIAYIPFVILICKELFGGFMMAVATFYILPFAIEISGVLTAFLGIMIGIFFCVLIRRLFQNRFYFEMMISFGILIVYHKFSLPFSSCFGNGLFLAILGGILLSVQIQYLSFEKKEKFSPNKTEIWYLFGLIVGILLK